jgi:lipoate-protein ligase A
MSIFAELDVDHDDTPRSAAMNMAIDEALLEIAEIPSIRFYRWNSCALSFGYFGKFVDVATYATQRDIVRRWTGGGIVFHGHDLTYSVIIPASAELFAASATSIYAAIHSALRAALIAQGEEALLADARQEKVSESCFANPVRSDVLLNGRKVAGAAQRRARAGLLHQGSIQYVDLAPDFAERFARVLSANCNQRDIDNELLNRAREIAQEKYQTVDWLQRR